MEQNGQCNKFIIKLVEIVLGNVACRRRQAAATCLWIVGLMG